MNPSRCAPCAVPAPCLALGPIQSAVWNGPHAPRFVLTASSSAPVRALQEVA
jgi:hypothetical protein